MMSAEGFFAVCTRSPLEQPYHTHQVEIGATLINLPSNEFLVNSLMSYQCKLWLSLIGEEEKKKKRRVGWGGDGGGVHLGVSMFFSSF